VVNQAFSPAQTSVVADSFVARNPLLLLYSTVARQGQWYEKPESMRNRAKFRQQILFRKKT
jgi:hypothetical protein